MTEYEEQLKRAIMRRVRLVFLLRKIAQPESLKFIVLVFSAGSTLFLIQVKHVINNMSQLEVGAYMPYVFSSFLGTTLIVQSVMVIALVAGGLVTYDMARNVRNTRVISKFTPKVWQMFRFARN